MFFHLTKKHSSNAKDFDNGRNMTARQFVLFAGNSKKYFHLQIEM